MPSRPGNPAEQDRELHLGGRQQIVAGFQKQRHAQALGEA